MVPRFCRPFFNPSAPFSEVVQRPEAPDRRPPLLRWFRDLSPFLSPSASSSEVVPRPEAPARRSPLSRWFHDLSHFFNPSASSSEVVRRPEAPNRVRRPSLFEAVPRSYFAFSWSPSSLPLRLCPSSTSCDLLEDRLELVGASGNRHRGQIPRRRRVRNSESPEPGRSPTRALLSHIFPIANCQLVSVLEVRSLILCLVWPRLTLLFESSLQPKLL